jgi:hypothetical protein
MDGRTQMNKPIPTETAPGAAATGAGATHEEPSFPTILDRMMPVERLRAYRTGAFDRHERSVWVARYPEEAPIVNGELEWVALTMADLD